MKKIISLFVLAVMLASITSCSSTAKSTDNTGLTSEEAGSVSTESTAASSGSAEKQKLTVWLVNDGADYQKYVEDTFRAEHPEIDLTVVWYASEDLKTQSRLAIDSGTAPDIFVTNSGTLFKEFQAAGACMDLTSYIKENGWEERVNKDYLLPYTVDGSVYAFPTSPLTVWQTLYVNRDLLEANGITSDPKTVSELIDVVKTLKGNGVAPIAFGNKDAWPAIILLGDYFAQLEADTSACDAIISGTDKFTENASIKKAFTTVVDLAKSGAFMDGYVSQDHTAAIQAFATGQTAMLYNGSWWTSVADMSKISFNLDVIQLPLIDGLTDNASVQMSSDMGAIVYSGTKNIDACITFLDFMTSKDTSIAHANSLTSFSLYPDTNEDVDINPVFKSEAILRQFDKPSLSPYFDWMFPTAVTGVIKTSLQEAMDGRITVDEALQTIQNEMDQNIVSK